MANLTTSTVCVDLVHYANNPRATTRAVAAVPYHSPRVMVMFWFDSASFFAAHGWQTGTWTDRVITISYPWETKNAIEASLDSCASVWIPPSRRCVLGYDVTFCAVILTSGRADTGWSGAYISLSLISRSMLFFYIAPGAIYVEFANLTRDHAVWLIRLRARYTSLMVVFLPRLCPYSANVIPSERM